LESEATTEIEQADIESPEGEVENTEETDEDIEGKKKAKSEKTQRRINKLTRRAKEAEEKAAALEQEMSQYKQVKEPQLEDFDSIDDFANAKVEYLSKEKSAPTPTPAEGGRDYQDIFSRGTEQYKDFTEKVQAPELPMSPDMADTISECDNDIDIFYHLANNPVEAERIALLDTRSMAREIGKLDASIKKPATKTSQAPKPVSSLKAGSDVGGKETQAQWVARRNKERAAQGKI